MNKKNLGWLLAGLLLVTAAVIPITSNFFTSPNYSGTTAATARTYLGLGSIATNAEGRFLMVTNLNTTQLETNALGKLQIKDGATVSNVTARGTTTMDSISGEGIQITAVDPLAVPFVVNHAVGAAHNVASFMVGNTLKSGVDSNGAFFGDGSLLTGITDTNSIQQLNGFGTNTTLTNPTFAGTITGLDGWVLTNETRVISATNTSNHFGAQHIQFLNTNIYVGIGTITGANGSHFWTNNSTGFNNIRYMNLFFGTNGHQFQVVSNVSSTIIYSDIPCDYDSSGGITPWWWYSNYADIYDSVPRQTGAIDAGGSLGIKGASIANAGNITFDGGAYMQLSMISHLNYGGYGPMLLFRGATTIPVFFGMASGEPNNSFAVLNDGWVMIGQGISNIAGSAIPLKVPLQLTTGSPSAGKILTATDGNGTAAWSNAPSGSGLSSLTVPAYLSTNGSLTDPVISGNGNAGTFSSLQVTNTASASALSVTNTASVSALNVTNTAAASALTVTNDAAAKTGTFTNAVFDKGPPTNSFAGFGSGGILTNWFATAGTNVTIQTNNGSVTINATAGADNPWGANHDGGGFGLGNVSYVIAPSAGYLQAHNLNLLDADGFIQLNQSFIGQTAGDPNGGSAVYTTGTLLLDSTTNGAPWVKTTSGAGNTGYQQLTSANTVTDIVNAITLPATNFLAATNGAGTNLLITNMTVAGYMRPVLATAVFASSTNYVVDFNLSDYENATLTADVNFQQSTNRSSTLGGKKVLTLYPNGTNRTVTLSAGGAASWHTNGFYSTSFTLTNNTYATITFYCNGSTETNVFSKYQIWP